MADLQESSSSPQPAVVPEQNHTSLSLVETESLVNSVNLIPSHYPPPPLYLPRRSPSCPSPRRSLGCPRPAHALSESPPLLHPRVRQGGRFDSTQSEITRRRLIGPPEAAQFPPPLVPRSRESSCEQDGARPVSSGSRRKRNRAPALVPPINGLLACAQVKDTLRMVDVNTTTQSIALDKLSSGIHENLQVNLNERTGQALMKSEHGKQRCSPTNNGGCLDIDSPSQLANGHLHFTNNASSIEGSSHRVGDAAHLLLPSLHKKTYRTDAAKPRLNHNSRDERFQSRTRTNTDGQRASCAVVSSQPQSVNLFIAAPSKPSQSALDQVFVLDHWPLPSSPPTQQQQASAPSNNIHLTRSGVPNRRMSGNVYVDEPSSVAGRGGCEIKELPTTATSGNVALLTQSTNHRVWESSNQVITTPPGPNTTDKFKSVGGSPHPPGGGDDDVDRCQEGLVCPRCGRCRCAYCTGAGLHTLPSCWMCGGRYECSVRTAVDYCTCLCAVRTVFYHCLYHEDDDVDIVTDPCACGEAPPCCLRWSFISAVLPCLPCLLCYCPLRCLLDVCDVCRAACAGRRGCHCMDDQRCASSMSDATTSTSTNTRSLLMAPENSSA